MENLRLLYEPIILEASLNEAFRKQQLGLEPPPPEEHNPFQPESDAFKCFANKLAQICDNERGGDTVTAIAVLVGEDGPQYVLGSNAKNEGQIINTENFLGQLLKYVIETMDDSKRTQKNVAKKALWRILKFNQGRVRLYSDQLTKTLDECIDQLDHEAQEFNEKKSQDEPSLQVSMVQPDMPLRDELKALKSKATFAIDFTTSNAEDKSLSNCESLIRQIHVIRTSGDSVIETALLKRTREGQVNMAEKWCKLRHLLGRWSSYRQAADVIITGAYRWPTLFQGFTIVSVPSSVRNDNPVPKSDLTAADIVRKMVGKDAVDKDVLVEEAEELQHKFDVDVTIQKHVRSKRFRPLVHAEVLVHDYLTKQGVDHSSQYWNSWNYIGTSKPACRLCQYYFQEHPNHVYVRQSHLNLYTNWRLPDAFNDDESNMVVELLRRIAGRMHGDVKRTLRQKTARGKRQDSNTYSKIPPLVRPTYDIAKTVTSGIAELEVGGSIDNNADDSLSTTGNDDWSGVEGDEEQNV